MKEFHIRKVWERKNTNQKMVTLPHTTTIQTGEYVLIQKIKLQTKINKTIHELPEGTQQQIKQLEQGQITLQEFIEFLTKIR